MKRIVTISFLLSVVLSLGVGTTTFAQSGQPPQSMLQRPFTLGKIVSLGNQQIALQKLDGLELTVHVNEQTRYRIAGEGESTFNDLQVGRYIAGYGRKNTAGEAIARLVVMLPEGFDPSKLPDRRIAGQVIEVDNSDNSLSVETRLGMKEVIGVDQDTQYLGEVKSLSEVEAGMVALAAVRELDDGSMLAVRLTTRFPVQRHVGTIVAVDGYTGSFTLHTKTGDDLIFTVDENTRYRDKGNSLQNLGDLKLGMLAYVSARSDSLGNLLAVQVAAITSDQLPKFDLRIGGRVTTVEDDSFSVQALDGQIYTIQVDDQTRFHSLLGQVNGLVQLKQGAIVLVGAEEISGGEYLAKQVFAIRLRLPFRPVA
jgi:hypothetical protein